MSRLTLLACLSLVLVACGRAGAPLPPAGSTQSVPVWEQEGAQPAPEKSDQPARVPMALAD